MQEFLAILKDIASGALPWVAIPGFVLFLIAAKLKP